MSKRESKKQKEINLHILMSSFTVKELIFAVIGQCFAKGEHSIGQYLLDYVTFKEK